ncbi:hypothetical protein [Flavobacterium sp.]|jgi:hypothetical protein|uniref:hypothetical protein n=1 Tax=Flavobacterium sp. TaxID=239 RepID=UPI002A8159F1|nr:hypothetical protein [Flavobacterium sp.]
MKLYCYLLFRFYWFYWFFRDVCGEGHKMARISSGLVGSLICFFHIIIFQLVYALIINKAVHFLAVKLQVVIILAVLFFLNYFFLLKNNKFKRYNFKKSKEGGIMIIIYILVMIATFIYLANINRDKIFNV